MGAQMCKACERPLPKGNVRIAAVCGSLREGSHNMYLLKTAEKLAPTNAVIVHVPIKDLPMFNEDLEASPPKSVLTMKTLIAGCDAVLFAVPEYNFDIAAPLKNMVDWASRPGYGGGNVFNNKPCAMVSAAYGDAGGHRAQLALRECINFLNMPMVNQPMVCIGASYKAFDNKGNLLDEDQRDSVKEITNKLVDLTLALKEFHTHTFTVQK